MLKFKFNYSQNTLSYQKPFSEEYWYPITDQFEGNFGSQVFQLTDGWINFTVYQSKIRAFYKQTSSPLNPNDFWEPLNFTYYRKDLPKQEEVIFTFSEKDQVEKVSGTWRRKYD